MYLVAKESDKMAVRDEIQLAAFLNSGWKRIDIPVVESTYIEKETAVEFNAETGEVAKEESIDAAAQHNYTKTDINRMSKADLQKYGEELGIENVTGKGGGELKTEIIGKLGL